MQINRLLLFLFFIGMGANAQLTIQGTVKSASGDLLKNVSLEFNEFQSFTNEKGEYSLELPSSGNYQVIVGLLFYESIFDEKQLNKSEILHFVLEPEIVLLNTYVIQHQHESTVENKEIITQNFLREEFSGSLAKSLEKIPGLQSMEIGSGTSKPVIRGLGFNRISVAENGIKQEGQQWGADHGLEISPWSIEKVEIIKGAGTLEFGSDAMGGVISIQKNQKPKSNSFSGDFTVLGRSVNQALGTALNLQQRKNKFYWKFAGSFTDFADYKIPTESITYLTRIIPIFNEELKNTAGSEHSTGLQIGFVDDDVETVFNLSHYYQKLGFFPGAHGIPDLSRVQDDGDRRNIEFPYQNVNHFKLSNETTLPFRNGSLKFLTGFQNNHRQEWSLFHTHYGNAQEAPLVDPDLELDFNLSTYDAQIKYEHQFSRNFQSDFGIQSQIQQNSIKGYNFLLPEFDRQNYAAYVINQYKISPKWQFNFGVRLDFTQLKTQGFFDEHLHTFLLQNGYSTEESAAMAQRSSDLKKDYLNFNYSIGTLIQPFKQLDFNLNLTSNFRVPNAIELSSNGIHHGSFRHEKGNPNLNPEKGWSSDLKFTYHPKGWHIELNPYLYYFQNYIFLEPTVQFSPLPHGGQIYQYNQTKAFITGAEMKIEKRFWNRLDGFLSVEYLYNQQISSEGGQNYPLPFTPPLRLQNEWTLDLIQQKGIFEKLSVSANFIHAKEQNRIARNEEITGSYTVLGAGIQSDIKINRFRANLYISGQNLTNAKYFNHMSFYRALEIPEMGRNIQIILRIPFGK